MRINLDRLCRLAGVEGSGELLSEASNRSMHDDQALDGEAEYRFGSNQLAEGEEMDPMEEGEEMDPMEEGDPDADEANEAYLDEMIEVDEAMLVQEIRRARQLMAESRNRQELTEAQLQEQQLRKIVAEEIDGVMKDLNLTAGWVYGSNKPKNSRRGVVNTAFPGIGFKNSK